MPVKHYKDCDCIKCQPSGATKLIPKQPRKEIQMCDCGETPLKEMCDDLRVEIKKAADKAHALLSHSDCDAENVYPGQRAEMKANIMLTYRHLEDARMRVGKILQAADNGVSILDKPLVGTSIG